MLFDALTKRRLRKIECRSLSFSKTWDLSLLESPEWIVLLLWISSLLIINWKIILHLSSIRLIQLWNEWLIWNELVFCLLLHQWVLSCCLEIWNKTLVWNTHEPLVSKSGLTLYLWSSDLNIIKSSKFIICRMGIRLVHLV